MSASCLRASGIAMQNNTTLSTTHPFHNLAALPTSTNKLIPSLHLTYTIYCLQVVLLMNTAPLTLNINQSNQIRKDTLKGTYTLKPEVSRRCVEHEINIR